MPRVQEVSVPQASRVRQVFGAVDFCDAYQVQLSRPEISVEQAYREVFAHSPRWARALMKVRGWLVAPFGLMHPTEEMNRLADETFRRPRFEVGQRIGIFTIQSIEPDELIAGEDDKHLDFRVSVLKAAQQEVQTLTVTTAVKIHNALGRAYLLLIKPFHRAIVRAMLQRAVDAGRL